MDDLRLAVGEALPAGRRDVEAAGMVVAMANGKGQIVERGEDVECFERCPRLRGQPGRVLVKS